MFLPTSRYFDIPRATLTGADGREVVYVRRRFVPFVRSGGGVTYTVTQGDRLDNVAARTLGDPEVFWRICDANGAMRPDELTESTGRVLQIPLFSTTR
jgi:nucleoid-associated protein YgaU